MKQKLIFTNLVGQAVDTLAEGIGASDIALITDTNTAENVLHIFQSDSNTAAKARVITIKAGDSNKTLDQLADVWRSLADGGTTRSSLIINLGGGMVTDLGGFAAATFKRGVKFINVPTTLLGAVDASVGGKTAINFNGIKNQIGAFCEPEAAVISTVYLNTLPQQEILSGYAEMLKHALLNSAAALADLLDYNPVYPTFDSERLLPLLESSVEVKRTIVQADPTEHGLRKALNLGHTAGHAIESLAMARHTPVPHGYAVAWGTVIELVISHMQLNFPSATLHQFAQYILDTYGAFDIRCTDYDKLTAIMRQDKKNASPEHINFTLLADVGAPIIDRTADTKQIGAAFDIYRDLMHLA